MRIHAFILTWNEEIRLPLTLRHYGKFCDSIAIYDNESTDRTREIALSFPRVRVFSYQTRNEFNDVANLYVKNNVWKASRGAADWVIVVDCDELVYHPDIHAYLAQKKAEGATIITPQWWNMVGTDLPGCEGERPMGAPHPSGKPTVFDPNLLVEINYEVGAHDCNPQGVVRRVSDDAIKTLHYKHLSLAYVLGRHAIYRERMSDINRREKLGHHYDADDAAQEAIFTSLVAESRPLPQENQSR